MSKLGNSARIADQDEVLSGSSSRQHIERVMQMFF